MEKLAPSQVTDKVFELTEQFNRYVFEHPEILDAIPDKAVLVFLDPDDPDFNHANIERARSMSHPDAGRLIYIEMRRQVRVVEQIEWTPQIKALPLAA